jgi:cysteine desulfurase / selenocysteine lyase
VAERRIYLDNAATSWPKPAAVYEAVEHYLRNVGAPAGRGAYAEALEVDAQIASVRRRVAQMVGASSPNSVIFTSGATESLNLAIHGLLRPGDHVVTTVAEHNSVLRPLRFLEEARQVSVSRIGCDGFGMVDLDSLRASLRSRARLVAITHASNVTGAIQPIDEVIHMAHDAGALVLVDAAQTLGHRSIDVSASDIDLLAAPGHKGLLGPLGTGVLYIRPGLESEIAPLKQGGTGTSSDQDRQPDETPWKFESGSPNVPGILGLEAAAEFILDKSIAALHHHEQELASRALEALSAIKGVQLYGPTSIDRRAGLVSFTIEGYDPQEVAATLDAARRIQVRAGFHCAASMHQCLGTAKCGGTVRLSWGPFNTADDIAITAATIGELAAAAA